MFELPEISDVRELLCTTIASLVYTYCIYNIYYTKGSGGVVVKGSKASEAGARVAANL